MQTLTKLSDDQLVAAYINGDNEAFDTLLNRHQSNTFSYIYHLVKDEELANDLFQETFVKVITTLKQERYSGDGKFASWLMRIAHNLIVDHFRQSKSNALVSTDDEDLNVLNRKDLCCGTIEDALIDEQTIGDVLALVETLPEEQRTVVELRFYQDLSFKEIAERTGVSINTALGRMRYAILNLRRRAKERLVFNA